MDAVILQGIDALGTEGLLGHGTVEITLPGKYRHGGHAVGVTPGTDGKGKAVEGGVDRHALADTLALQTHGGTVTFAEGLDNVAILGGGRDGEQGTQAQEHSQTEKQRRGAARTQCRR